MKTYLWLAVTVGQACLLGCAQQQLGGVPRDGGPGADAGCGPPGKLACSVATGCTTTAVAPLCVNGSWTCPPDRGTTITCEPPICPASLLPGCTCDPATGVTTCRDAGACPASAPDGSILFCVQDCSDHTAVGSTCDGGAWSCPSGTIDIETCGERDAGARDAGERDAGPRDAGACPAVELDGGVPGCGCSSDTAPRPACVAGAWTCPPGTGPVTVCPRYCSFGPPPPPGCTCDPASGALVCKRDAGGDTTGVQHGG
jgi:hypothetical protein